MPELHLDAVIYEEDGLIVTHILQLDLVGTGKNKRASINDLIAALEAQLSYTLENNNMDHFFKAAPSDIWEMFPKV